VNTAFLLIERIPLSYNNAAVPPNDFPSVRYKHTRDNSRGVLISRPRVKAPAFLPGLPTLPTVPAAAAQIPFSLLPYLEGITSFSFW
jgi:hypothetical protein